MKLGPVTTIDKRNKATPKKFNDNVISVIFDVIVIFPIYGQFRAIWKPDFELTVCKNYIFINSNLTKIENETKKSLRHLSRYFFE